MAKQINRSFLIFLIFAFTVSFLACTSQTMEEEYQEEIQSGINLLVSGVKTDYPSYKEISIDEIYLTFEEEEPVVLIKSLVTLSSGEIPYYLLVTFKSGMTNELFLGNSDTLTLAFQSAKSSFQNGEEGYYQVDQTLFKAYLQEVLE